MVNKNMGLNEIWNNIKFWRFLAVIDSILLLAILLWLVVEVIPTLAKATVVLKGMI